MQTVESASDSPAPSTPGDALQKLFMQPLGLTAYRLSTDLEVAPIAVSQILRGRRAISAAMALRLGTYFGVDPSFWLALQAAHDLQMAARAAQTPGPNGEPAPGNTVTRCRALEGRQLVLRESRVNGKHQWEVLMVSSAAATAKAAAGGNGKKPVTGSNGKGKPVNGGKVAKKVSPKAGRALAGARR